MRHIGRALLCALMLLSAPAMADDLSNGSWSTTDASNTAAPPNGWPAGMFPNQVEPAARAMMGAVRRWWERENANLSTTGSAGAYVLTPSNASYPTAYTQGEVYCAKANFSAVGNDTLNVNSLGAKPIYNLNGSNAIAKIPANAILSGAMFCAAYDSALNSGGGGFQLIATLLPSGFGSAAFQATSAFLQPSNNLSDVSSAATSRTNLGLGSAATQASSAFDAAGAASAVQSASLQKSSNLSDVTSVGTARNNLGLGNAAQATINASNAGPSGGGNNGDLWIQW